MLHTKIKTTDSKMQAARKNSSSTTSPDEDSRKTAGRKRYKSLLICTICDGEAHGYNFDAISCESCKAFFRRNASRLLEKLKCRGDEHCSVHFNVKKRCKRCRLQKCLEQGMRKDWILSDEEKRDKRAKIEQNRLLRQLSLQNSEVDVTVVASKSTVFLTDQHWLHIQSIQDGYVEAVKLNQIAGIAHYPSIQPIESTLDLFRVPLYISSMRLITFLKQANHFQQLQKKDQLYLIKTNLITICFYHSMYVYDPSRDCYHEPDTTDPLFSGNDWNKTLSKQFHFEMKRIRNELIDIFQLDNTLIKLFMLIILYSQQMSAIQFLNNDIDSSSIFKAQNLYTDLLYRYCLEQYGSSKGCNLFARYIFNIMKLQGLVDDIKLNAHNYMDINKLSPLTQSLLT